MRVHTQTRLTRKAAIAVAILGATLLLPGAAGASHDPNNIRNPYTCDPAVPDECPAFEVDFSVRVQNPVKAQHSSVQFRFDQPDRRMPVMRADYYLPAGWRFGGINNLDSAVQADGITPATSCSQLYTGSGLREHPTSTPQFRVTVAEVLSADTGMLVQTDGRRADDPADDEEAVNAVADPLLGPATNSSAFRYGIQPNHTPTVAFLNWDPAGGPDGAGEADLCYFHRHVIPSGGPTPPELFFIQEATLTRLTSVPGFDWKLSTDIKSVMNDPQVRDQRASILEHHLALGALTAGSWNKHPITGEFQKVPFSRTPLDAGSYAFRADLFTCAEGLNPADSTGCTNGTFVGKTLSQVVNITPAPDTQVFDWAKLNGPQTPGLCFNAVCPLGLVRGSSSFNATWAQPALVDGQEVLGYAVTLALPGNQASRKFYRLVTKQGEIGFNPAICGPAGGDPTCSLPISLPTQSSDGSTTLTADKKYHLALVTIYDDGRRTDGLCDDATGEGVDCPDGTPRLNVKPEPGISSWQVLVKPDAWPVAYIETWDDTSNATHDPFTNRLLLVDYTLKEAEFIIWNTNDQVRSYRAVSNGIIGDNSTGVGVVEINNGTNGGAMQNWVLAVVADPILGVAVGPFARYDIKNPGLNPITIGGWPELGQPGCEDLLISMLSVFPSSCFTFFGTPL